MRLPSGVPGFDEMVEGGLPAGACVVLQGPPGREKLRFALTFLAEGLKSGAVGLIVVSSNSPDSILTELRSLGVDLDQVISENRLRIVDWYSQLEEPIQDVEEKGIVVRSSIDLTNVGVALSRAIAALGGDKPRRAVVELLSPAMSVFEVGQVYAFAQSSRGKFLRFNYTALYLLEKEMHGAAELSTLHQPFAGVIEIERTRVGDRIVRKIGVLHLKDTVSDSAFRVLEDTGAGLKIVRESRTESPSREPPVQSEVPGASRASAQAPGESEEKSVKANLIARLARERLKLNPSNPGALFALAAAQASVGDVRGSLDALKRLVQVDDRYPGVWVLKAKLHARMGDKENARLSRIRAEEAAQRLGDEEGERSCPSCGAIVPEGGDRCARCGWSLQSDEKPVDERTALGHLAIQEEAKPEPRSRPVRRPARRAPSAETAPPKPPSPSAPAKKPASADGRVGLTNGLAQERVGARPAGMTNGLRGRTNGLTNGRGRTNGLRGRSYGLTNGLRGRTNGLTNGLTNGRGRTNGLTNGLRGRTNGLTNGLGHTNGLTNGMGRTNGLTNGLLSLRRGLTNGLTNGSGFTNGLGSRRFQREARLNRWKLYLIPLVTVSLLMLSLAAPTEIPRSSVIQIDGSFGDWTSAPTFAFQAGTGNADVDLVGAAFVNESTALSLLLEVRGSILAGSPSDAQMDAVYIFLDLDADPGTGYTVRSLGADRLLEIQGRGGVVSRATAYQASAALPDRRDWRVWVDPAPFAAAAAGARLEMQIDWLLLGDARAPPAVFVASRSWDGSTDSADYLIAPRPGHVLVVQRHVAPAVFSGGDLPVLTLALEAIDADVRLSGVTVDLLGTAPASRAGRVRLLDETSSVLAEVAPAASRAPLTFPEIILQPGQVRLWTVTLAGSGSTSETLGAVVRDGRFVAAADALVTVRSVASAERLGYLGQVPVGPIVDGAFAEWTSDVMDAVGEPETLGNPSVDVERFGAMVGAANVSFHVRLQGPAFEGTVLPTVPGIAPPVVRPDSDRDRDTVPDADDTYPDDFDNDGVPDAQSGGDHDGDNSTDYTFGGSDTWLNTTIPGSFPPPYAGRNVTVFIGPSTGPPALGEDRLRLFVDADNNSATGFYVGGLGADYLIEMEGREGSIATATASTHAGGGPGAWSWTTVAPVAFAQSPLQVEAVGDIAVVVPSPAMYLEMSDWAGGRDTLTASANAPPSLTPTLFAGPAPRFVATADGPFAVRSTDSALEVYVREDRGEGEEIVLRHGSLFVGWRTTGLDLGGGVVAPSFESAAVAGHDIVLPGFVDAWEHYVLGGDRVKHNLWLGSVPRTSGDALLLQGTLRIPDGATVYVDGQAWDGGFTTEASIVVEYEGQRIRFEAPFAYESRRPSLTVPGWYAGEVNGSLVSLSMAVPAAWLHAPGRQYPVVLDPTGIIDTATTTPTGGPAQRNVFHDGSYFWAFYSDGTNTVYEPSADGFSWVNTKSNAFVASGIGKPSVWFHDTGSTKIVYVVGDGTGNDATVVVRRGTISGTTITWGTEATITVSSASVVSKTAFITRDSSGFLWIGSSSKSGGGANYVFSATRSTNADDVSAWNAHTLLLDASVSNNFVQGVIVPLGSGEVYGLWYADGAIDGKKYTGTWGAREAIDTTTAGVLTHAPSAVVDSSFNIHLVYVDSAGAVKYRQRTTSWSAPTTLDAASGNTYATISRETTSGDLYAFYIASGNQIKAQKYSGSWSSLTLETNTKAKSALTSIYQIGHPARVAWTWSQGSASPFDVKFSLIGMDAMYYKQGTFVRKTDGTGAQAITGVGFQPKALVLWYSRVSDQTFTANDYFGFGIAASTTQRYATALASDNALATTNTARGSAVGLVRIFSNGNPTVDGVADLQSFDADGFTLSWTTNPNPAHATILHYIALGGPGLTNAFVGQFTGPAAAATGNRAFTGVGFLGDFGLFITTNQGALGDQTGESFGIGAAVTSSSRAALSGGGNDGMTTGVHSERYLSATNALVSYGTGSTTAALTTDNVADFVSWDSDGFTLSYTKVTTGSVLFWGLILKGGNYATGNFQIPNSGTTPLDQSIAGVGFRPKGVMFLTDDRDALDTEGGQYTRMISAGTDAGGAVQEDLVWNFNREVYASDSDMRTSTTKAIATWTSSGSTTGKPQADFKSSDPDGFTITHTLIPTGTVRVIYWAFGDSYVASRTVDTSTDNIPTKYNHQRKVFHDGSRFWVFYYDGSNTVYTSSVDGLTWENSVDRAWTTQSAVGQASVWFHDTGSTKIVYAVGEGVLSDSTLSVRRGTISGGTITWGTQETATISTSDTVPKIAFITRDTNGFLWIASSAKNTATTFNVAVVKSTNADDVSLWGSITYLLSAGISADFVYPTILPMAGGDMYALWYADGAIDGREYTGTWGTVESIASTTAGVSTKIPSAVVDGSDNIHLVYVDTAGSVQYTKRTTSWGTASSLDFLRPEWDIDLGTWTTSPLWSRLDDNDDTDFVSATAAGTDEVGLKHIADPGVDTGHIIRFRARATGAGPVEEMQVSLYQGGSLIAQTAVTTITRGSFNTYSYSLTSGEAAAITDYNDLRLRLVATTLGGGSDQLDLAWAELEVPGLSGSKSPTITRDTSTGDLYAFYIGSDGQIKGRKFSTAWTMIQDIDLSTTSKDYITSPYTVSSATGPVWAWGQGGSSPYEVKVAKIPEFEEVALPLGGTLLILLIFRHLRKRTGRHGGEQPI